MVIDINMDVMIEVDICLETCEFDVKDEDT